MINDENFLFPVFSTSLCAVLLGFESLIDLPKKKKYIFIIKKVSRNINYNSSLGF